MEKKSIHFLDKKITYYSAGNAPKTIVFLHGFFESSIIWEDYANRLKNSFRIICIDLLGHGETESIGDVHTTLLMSDALNAVLKAENITSCILIGHSMGGYVGLTFGERYFEKTKGVILVNSTAMDDSRTKKLDRDRAIKVMEKNPSIFINEAIPNLFPTEGREKYKEIIEVYINNALKTSTQGAVACLRGMKYRDDKTYLLQKGKFPLMIIAGTNDNVIPVEMIIPQMSLNSSIDSVLLEGCGHMSFIEEKEKCFEAISRFVYAMKW